MDQVLRPFQMQCLALLNDLQPGQRILFVAPTGTGKTHLMGQALISTRPGAVLITPSLEIVRSLLARTGLGVTGRSESSLWREAESIGIFTPVRLRNRLRTGLRAPTTLLVDEGHHSTDGSAVVTELSTAVGPGARWIGWTATPYRGSQPETAALREFWGEPHVLVSMADAAAAGYLSIPTPDTIPLLDDSSVKEKNGEFDPESAADIASDHHVWSSLATVANRWIRGHLWDRPTMIAVPTVVAATECATALRVAGIGAEPISGDCSRAERDSLLARCQSREIAIVQVKVLAEGVDMPWLRRLIDLRPLRSPVAWMQLVGRITRPAPDTAPEYISGCRNLERHGYLIGGRWPAAARKASALFGEYPAMGSATDRSVAKDVLFGRKRIPVHLADGSIVELIHLGRGWNEEILIIAVPGNEYPIMFERHNSPNSFGRWAIGQIEASGFAGWTRAVKPAPMSDRQLAWWRSAAGNRGLDPKRPPTRDGFAILPALSDTNTTLHIAPTRCTIPMTSSKIADTTPEPSSSAGARQSLYKAPANPSSSTEGPPAAPTNVPTMPRRDSSKDCQRCGRRLPLLTVRKTGPNHGRQFYSCRVCDLFEWAETVIPTGERPALDGYYATGTTEESTKFWHISSPTEGRWANWLFLSSVRSTGSGGLGKNPAGARRPDGAWTHEAARTTVTTIATDPDTARRRFGQLLGLCGHCGLGRTDPAARAAGIGPVCANR